MQPELHPDHALSFSADAVHLLRRSPSIQPAEATRPEEDWEVLGSAAFSSPNFRQDLAALRAAVQPEQGDALLPVVLVIPDDQILYTDLQVPTGEGRELAVGAALDGLTPYPIDQLAFDWRGEGTDIRVAAVARQTLLEAQEFANRHGFDGREYTARPADADYPGMPVFALSEAQTDFDSIGEDLPIAGLHQLDYAPEEPGEDYDYTVDSGLNLDLDADLGDEAFADVDGVAEADEALAPEVEVITDVAFTELGQSLTQESAGAEADGQPEAEGALVADAAAEDDAQSLAALVVEDAQIEDLPRSEGASEPEAEEATVPDDADVGPYVEDAAFAEETLPATEAEEAFAPSPVEDIATEAPAADPSEESLSERADVSEADAAVVAEAWGAVADQVSANEQDETAAVETPDAESLAAIDMDQPEREGDAADAVASGSASDEDEANFLAENGDAEAGVQGADDEMAQADEPQADQVFEAENAEDYLPETGAEEHTGTETEGPDAEGFAEETGTGEAAEEDDDLTEAEREALAAAALEVAAAEAAAGAASGPTVVRHGTPPAHLLNPRARAVRERAEEARRNPNGAPSAGARPVAPMRRRARSGKGELVVMLGALLVGLVLVWAFFAPGERPAETAMRNVERGIVPPAGEAQQSATAAPQSTGQTATTPAPMPASSAMTPVERAVVIAAATEPSGSLLVLDPAGEAQVSAPATAPETTEPAQAQTPAQTPLAEAPAPVAPAPAAPQEVAAAPLPASPAPAAPAPQAAPAPAAPAQTPSPAPQAAATPAPEPRQSAPAAAPAAAAQPARRAEPAAAPSRAPATAATAPARSRALASSARPQSATAPRRRATEPRVDTPPNVPSNPIPFEAAQRETVRPAAVRPPTRPSARPAATPAPRAPAATQSEAQPASAAAQPSAARPNLRASNRPPSRPEGAAPDPEGMRETLTPAEQHHLDGLIKDLRASFPGAEAVRQNRDYALSRDIRFERYAEARPARRPAAITARGAQGGGGAVDAGSVDAAVRAANAPPASSNRGSAMPAQNSGGLLHSSSRPHARPLAARAGAAASGAAAANDAVEAAVASAVSSAPVSAGGVALTALASSPLPPRRAAGAAVQSAVEAVAAAAAAPERDIAALAPTSAQPAAPEGPNEAELAERRRLDEQLQSQAEARVRARAQADAAAEAQARAQAEARARAQVAAEERTAAAQRQRYKPQEIDDEPEVAAAPSGGKTTASVASAATQKRAIDLGRTTIIGIIGAGNASRALIRLRSGKIVTVRLGDKIDGGTINSIGDGRVTYVKSGRTHELKLLDGR
ncbi:hypothetical protein [Paracoccus cavernae]|uniref:hypothetical protein n=2 Tax=Paracoccus cavernae TaxID=1571207 RepID=UPI0035F2659A